MEELPLSKIQKAREILAAHSPVLIAFSGGVDSSVLAALAVSCGSSIPAVALIADSPSLPRRALEGALATAKQIGIPLRITGTREMDDPEYVSNPLNRCYFCKAELFRRMESLAREEGFRGIAYGENADDPAQERPGSIAAKEFSVLAPLREAGLGKAEIRNIARSLNLDCAELPAEPCLSSRIPHGTPVTLQALRMIESAETFLKSLGFSIVRVRHIERSDSADSPAARIQVPGDQIPELRMVFSRVESTLRSEGYKGCEIDPLGYRGASLELPAQQPPG